MNAPDSRPSIRDRIRPVEAGEPIVGAHILGETAVILTAGGEAILADARNRRVRLHDGVILVSACDGRRLVTGGDDGKVVVFDLKDGARVTHDAGGRWIDQVALGGTAFTAWSVGKKVHAQDGKAAARTLDIASAAGGLAFFPKGFRLAIAHYGGASLWYPNSEAKPVALEWKGSHLGATVSPDARFVVTAMQENQLHGWRLEDGQHMRMSGYPTKVRSWAWTSGGKFLATAGADEAILWPFAGKNGPMGATPTMIAPGTAAGVRVRAVAAHPKAEVIAAGFSDGLILLVRIDDGAEILLRAPDGDAVTALAWGADGAMIAFGTASGAAGLARL